MAVIALLTLPPHWSDIGPAAWAGLAYVSVFSMFVGFVFWYRGLAIGGIAAVGQLQLLQPFFGLTLAALLLHEPIAWTMVLSVAVVVLCVAGARRFARSASQPDVAKSHPPSDVISTQEGSTRII